MLHTIRNTRGLPSYIQGEVRRVKSSQVKSSRLSVGQIGRTVAGVSSSFSHDLSLPSVPLYLRSCCFTSAASGSGCFSMPSPSSQGDIIISTNSSQSLPRFKQQPSRASQPSIALPSIRLVCSVLFAVSLQLAPTEIPESKGRCNAYRLPGSMTRCHAARRTVTTLATGIARRMDLSRHQKVL